MGALQYGVRALLTQLEPAALQAAADHGGIGLPGQRRARAWAVFEKRHGEITRALTDDLTYQRVGSANIWTLTCRRAPG